MILRLGSSTPSHRGPAALFAFSSLSLCCPTCTVHRSGEVGRTKVGKGGGEGRTAGCGLEDLAWFQWGANQDGTLSISTTSYHCRLPERRLIFHNGRFGKYVMVSGVSAEASPFFVTSLALLQQMPFPLKNNLWGSVNGLLRTVLWLMQKRGTLAKETLLIILHRKKKKVKMEWNDLYSQKSKDILKYFGCWKIKPEVSHKYI